jgi:asparaginyl-tRNA synthetase
MTSRHLAEFWMVEAEWAFVKSLEDVCEVVEEVLRSVWKDVGGMNGLSDLVHPGDDSEVRRQVVEGAFEDGRRWERMTYSDAVKALKKQHVVKPFTFVPEWGKSLKSEHERWLAEVFIHGPVFVTDYPAGVKPFYMRRNDHDEKATVACFDLIVPHAGELVGGSLREERLDMLVRQMERCGMNEGEYGWYAELRKFGGAPHAGFGIGFERLVGWFGGLENLRECIPMPRWAGRMLL